MLCSTSASRRTTVSPTCAEVCRHELSMLPSRLPSCIQQAKIHCHYYYSKESHASSHLDLC